RGTEQGLADWMTNLSLGKKRWEQGPARVHGGFLRALDSVWDEIAAELDRLSCPLFYTGHSLGGALATLAGARRTPVAIYTFGSPRVGDAAFVTLTAGLPIHRVDDDRDVVPTVPPQWLGFRHAGALKTVRESGIGEPEGETTGGPPKFLADHAPINYVDRVRGFRT
ncbi:MAG: lipase family protein, partial [Betaproteobacteria bacterium]